MPETGGRCFIQKRTVEDPHKQNSRNVGEHGDSRACRFSAWAETSPEGSAGEDPLPSPRGYWQNSGGLRASFLAVCWSEPALNSLPCGPPPCSSCFIKVSEKSQSCTLITAGTSHHLCHIPSVRSTLQILPTLKGRNYTEGNYQEVGVPGNHFTVCHRGRRKGMMPGILLINDVTSREGAEQEDQVRGAKSWVVNLKVNRNQDKMLSNCGNRDLILRTKNKPRSWGLWKKIFWSCSFVRKIKW